MFFVLSKLFWFVFGPINLLILLGVLGVALSFTRFARFGRGLAFTALITIAVCAFSPLGGLLLRPIEDRFPAPAADLPAPTGIIVLGGALDEQLSDARGQIKLMEAGTRLTTAVELIRRYPQARLIFSGGSGSLSDDYSEAKGVRRLWLSLGVPEERMSFEGKSRNTWENALFTRDLVKPKLGETWLIVTSAWHMPRSMGIFRKLGFDAIAYPVDYHTYGDSRDYKLTSIVLDELTMLNFAVHEWIGLAAYWLSGKTNAFFPAP
jgi:uncharacterized SAM-binding protein YcdF (DUF218 family)